jgi:hypothetical protein
MSPCHRQLMSHPLCTRIFMLMIRLAFSCVCLHWRQANTARSGQPAARSSLSPGGNPAGSRVLAWPVRLVPMLLSDPVLGWECRLCGRVEESLPCG